MNERAELVKVKEPLEVSGKLYDAITQIDMDGDKQTLAITFACGRKLTILAVESKPKDCRRIAGDVTPAGER